MLEDSIEIEVIAYQDAAPIDDWEVCDPEPSDGLYGDQVIRLNYLPLTVCANTNVSTDTYLWSTNAITPEIEITQVGTYSVTIKNQLGFQNTGIFNVIELESAIIDVVETIDFRTQITLYLV